MRKPLQDYLFSKGLFVGRGVCEYAPEVLAALAKLFNIRIAAHPEQARIDMVSIAARNLGEDVPLPFYEGFPESVRQLSLEELVLDRLLHYARTYGSGDFSQAGHSLFEQEVVRQCFNENAEVRELAIISEKEAVALLKDTADALLAGTRPLSDTHYMLVRSCIEDYGYEVAQCACKDTAVHLLLDTRDVTYTRLLKLSDVIRLVEQMQFQCYDSKDVKRLNLRNRDRVFLTAVLDRIFREGVCDMRTCYEKTKLWKGLLHHLHYKPVNDAAARFLDAIRNNKARSAYADFEQALRQGRIQEAVDVLRGQKGAGAVLRNLDYLLSRCETDADIDCVLDQIDTANKILLIQLLLHCNRANPAARRVFRFNKFGLMRVHEETVEEARTRGTAIDAHTSARICGKLRTSLAAACKGKLGAVYVDESMKRIALPLQESASQSGIGALPRGSRLAIPEGKKIRAFTYWERVDDIDLSAFGVTEDGRQIEFSWRSLPIADDEDAPSPIVFSGDQTSGYDGGSEYFDFDLPRFREMFPQVRYIVLCDNVFSGSFFSECLCKAGYMMRDDVDSGEIFEPKTVASSFAIACPSTFAYLFAIDLVRDEIIVLNTARDSRERVAGTSSMAFLLDYLNVTETINLYDFACMLATEIVDDPERADVVFSDRIEPAREGLELIRSRDSERVIQLLNA